MRKKFLQNKIERIKNKIKDLKARALASQSADEVRSIQDQIEGYNADMADAQEELDAILADEQQDAQRSAQLAPAGAAHINGGFLGMGGAFAQPANDPNGQQQRSDENPLASMEYRRAFREYVLRGTPIPAQLRNGEAISTNETGVAIPVTVMQEVINTVRKRYGNLYAKVRKTSVQGGVEYPIGALQASLKWINEGEVSPRQKTDKLGKISFGYHTGEIRVAQSFLSRLVTMAAFEGELSRIIAIAYVQAMDYGIVNGSGNGTMTGILHDPRVTNNITMTAADIADWQKWRKNFFAKLPLGYRAGEFIFPLSTVESYLATMHDANNNPIFSQATGLVVNDGDAQNPNGRFFGRNISLVEEDIIPDFDTAASGAVIGVYWQPEEYCINENFGFTMRRYFDDETNEWVDKALVVVDGKVLNPTGYYLIKKG